MENLAKAIKESGKSRYRIAKDTDIDNTVLFRIVNGGSCSIETADILLEYFGLTIANKKQREKSKAPTSKRIKK